MLFDAHCHLQDPRLEEFLENVLKSCRSVGILRWMVNATRESDWDIVSKLCEAHPGIYASYGLHPWWQKERSLHWEEDLKQRLLNDPAAGVGETGLDRWMENFDFDDQKDVLVKHLQIACDLKRPISLHCLKAWPELKAVVSRFLPVASGILLHSYSGPRDMIPYWVKAGAYFSFSPAFVHPRKSHVREAFMEIPLDRILIETDAPDMAPPIEDAIHISESEKLPELMNHPINLLVSLRALAVDRKISEISLAEILTENTCALFGL